MSDPGDEDPPVGDDGSTDDPPSQESPRADGPPPTAEETTPEQTATPSQAWRLVDDIREFCTSVETVRAVTAITALAVVLRLFALGSRPMHFDEARVAYWSIHYMESGSLTYQPVVHGPFIQLVNSWLFTIFGASDFLARLPVALAGGLLPASALLFREHLRKDEVFALSLFLAFNSVLVYYSRFMRSDMLLAAFMFTAFGLLVRYYDTRDVRLLYVAVVFVALGFTAKENAIVYILTWIGASALIIDQKLYRPRTYRTGAAVLKEFIRRRPSRTVVARYAGHLVGLGLVFAAVLVFFYADRGAGSAGIYVPSTPPSEGSRGLWEALGQPLSFPGYAVETLESAANAAIDHWGEPAGSDGSLVDTYVSQIGTDADVLKDHGIILATFGLLGFVWERYARGVDRSLVIFAGYCGIVSFFGYPLADDIGSAHWLHVHILVPLAIPAAVGLARFVRFGWTAAEKRDAIALPTVVGILLLVSAVSGAAMVQSSYVDSTSVDSKLAQYAQPEAEAGDAIQAINTVAGGGNETDVLVYTSESHTGRPLVRDPAPEGVQKYTRPLCLGTGWHNSLPLPWYLVKADADVICQQSPADLTSTVEQDPPKLIVSNTADQSMPRDQLSEDYTARTFEWFKFGHQVTFYLRNDQVEDVQGWDRSG